MEPKTMQMPCIHAYNSHMAQEEKSPATTEKYLRDIRAFGEFLGARPVTKELALAWKKHLLASAYTVNSVNSMLAGINGLFKFLGWTDCRVKTVRQQRQTYCHRDKELQKSEYLRLLAAAGKKPRLQLILQTICGTGIRVSELRYFTLESLQQGAITVTCKGKTRTILVPGKLRRKLLAFAREQGVTTGVLFRSRKGTPIHRSRVWAMMKSLCAEANVDPQKVFPHNLRKLFARTFYAAEKDIAKLADILGHSSINTTRIYIMSTGVEHRRKLEQLGLVL